MPPARATRLPFPVACGGVRFRWDRLDARSALMIAIAPAIYSLVVPLALLHAWIWLYEHLCFPVFGIPLVPWHAYVVLDRHRLAYLNGLERLNCAYCSYANGLFAYVREVAARTEAFSCPIQHARPVLDPHRLYRSFARFGDARAYKDYLKEHPIARTTVRPRKRRA